MPSASAQTSAPRAPDVTVSATTINEQNVAQGIHGYIEVQVTSFQLATANASDNAASCHPGGAAKPNATVWFEFSVGDGTLTLTTAGSTVVTSGGSDVVMAVYRSSSAIDAACDGGNTASPAAINTHLDRGDYYLVIGVPNTQTVTSGTLMLTMDYAPDVPLSYDDFANAKELKLPATPTVPRWEDSTYENDEILSSCYSANRPSNSVWYKFTLSQTSQITIIMLYAQGVGHESVFTASAGLGLYELTQFGLQEIQCDYPSSPSDYASLYGFFSPGTYYLRVESLAASGISFAGMANLVINPTINSGNPAFTNLDTITADMTGWTVKNGDVNDGPVCGVVSCPFVFTSSGAEERTKLVTTVDFTHIKLKKHDTVALVIYYAGESPLATAKAKFIYSDGTPKSTLKADLTVDTISTTLAFDNVTLPSGKVSSIKLTIKNKDLSLGDTLTIETASLSAIRLGEPAPRGVLPPPPPPAF